MKYKRELSTPCFSNCTLTLVKHSTHPIKQSSPDLGSLGVQSDGNARVHSVLLFVHLVGDPHVVDGLSMILVRPKRLRITKDDVSKELLLTRERNSYEQRSFRSR